MTTQEQLLAALAPIAERISRLDLRDPAVAATLASEYPSERLDELDRLFAAAESEGWLTPKRANERITFGRLAKPGAPTTGMSIDIVDMDDGAGLPHTHPEGEVSVCFPRSGSPTFEGCPRGWVVMPPGSRHVPTVAGGRMLIAYFLPKGAMIWE